jgi:hypothetical protein
MQPNSIVVLDNLGIGNHLIFFLCGTEVITFSASDFLIDG